MIVVVGTSIAVFGQQRDRCAEEQPYEYTTKLSGGYRIEFTTDDELKYLHLWRSNKRIAELSSVSCGLLHKNLGYVAADYPDHFAFVNSFGSGNPHMVALIRKLDGIDLLKKETDACWIDVNVPNSLFVYSDACVPKAKNRIALFNLETQKRRYLYFPKIVLSGTNALGRISIASISHKYVSLKFESDDFKSSITRRYRY